MKQIECLSQTAEFKNNQGCTPIHLHKSPTTDFLHQEPTPANTVRYKSKSGLVLVSLIIITACISGYTSCAYDRHQSAAQVEHLVKAGVKP